MRLFLRKSFDRLANWPRVHCIIDLPYWKPTTLLSSSGRSGSTWLQNIISKSARFRVMFEPFNPTRCQLGDEWKYKQYVGANDSMPVLREVAKNVLLGKIHNTWVDQDNTVLFPNKRLLKDIRTNLCLAWLKKQFPHIKVIFLLRHPLDVAKSRMRIGWGSDLEVFFKQRSLMESHFPQEEEFLRSITDPFVKQIAYWAIENIVPLRELSANDATVVAYEDLVAFPDQEITRILESQNLQSPKCLESVFETKSRTTVPPTTETVSLTRAQIESAIEVLARFELDKIYSLTTRVPPRLFEKQVFKPQRIATGR
jgi:hypothetical protein